MGESRRFGLEEVEPGSQVPEADFGFALVATNPFTLDECLCQVEHYSFDFLMLPPLHEISVTDYYGNPLNFQIFENPFQGTSSIVVDANSLEDASFAVFISFNGVMTPAVAQSGGLCIVNNLGGGDNPYPSTFISTSPYWIYKKAPPAPLINKIFIPTSMTTAL